MESLIILIPLSLLAVAVAIACFFAMSESGQFDDTEGPAWRVLLDDDATHETPENGGEPAATAANRTSLDLDQPASDADS